MRARHLARGPILTRQHRARWYEFAQEHQNWRLQDWHTVLFTDESRFHLSACDRHVRVWRRPAEWYENCNIVETDKYGGGSVMVWDGISYEGPTDLYMINWGTLTALRHRDEILDPIVRPSVTISFWCRIMRAPILLECAWITLIVRLLQ